MIYAINFDLAGESKQNREDLHEAIRSLGASYKCLESTWLVETDLPVGKIGERLASYVAKNDRMLVIGVTRQYSGWLPRSAWEWLNQRSMWLPDPKIPSLAASR